MIIIIKLTSRPQYAEPHYMLTKFLPGIVINNNN